MSQHAQNLLASVNDQPLAYGKHKGTPFSEITVRHPEYVHWARTLSAGSVRGVSAIQGRKERGTQVQPDMATASTGTLDMDGDTKTSSFTYNSNQGKWVRME